MAGEHERVAPVKITFEVGDLGFDVRNRGENVVSLRTHHVAIDRVDGRDFDVVVFAVGRVQNFELKPSEVEGRSLLDDLGRRGKIVRDLVAQSLNEALSQIPDSAVLLPTLQCVLGGVNLDLAERLVTVRVIGEQRSGYGLVQCLDVVCESLNVLFVSCAFDYDETFGTLDDVAMIVHVVIGRVGVKLHVVEVVDVHVADADRLSRSRRGKRQQN